MQKQVRDLSVKEYGDALRKKEFSAEEGVREFLNAIKKEDKDIHAFLSVFEEGALERAHLMDEKFARGENLHPLAGIPIAVKDNILIHGERTTAASRLLENYISAYDATAIQKLKDCGALFVGKTNLDEFAMGVSTEYSAFGPTRNPHDLSRVPGGSSGGSAAAVAARFAPLSLGSDTGGSVRQPASFCGVVGFKPSYGAVSRFGLIAMTSSIDQIGPLAHSVEDASFLFDAIEGKDRHDTTSLGVPVGEYSENDVKKIVIGIPKEYFGAGVDSAVRDEIEKSVNIFRENGFTIKEVSLPLTKYAISTYYIIVPAEVSANLARFDSIRYPKELKKDFEKSFSDLREKYDMARGYGFGDEVKRRILLGTFVLSAGYYDEYYKKAEKVRELITREFESVWNEVDILIAPTTPSRAFKFGEKSHDPLQMYACDMLTSPANLAGLPALSVPVKRYEVLKTKDERIDLPIGIQFIGKQFHDREVLALGKFYEKYLRG